MEKFLGEIMPSEIVTCAVSDQNWAIVSLVMEFCRQFHLICRFGFTLEYEQRPAGLLKVKITSLRESFSLEFLTSGFNKEEAGVWPSSGILYLDLEKAGREFCGFKSRKVSFQVSRRGSDYRFIGDDFDGRCRCFKPTDS